jgi:hypothetical protein
MLVELQMLYSTFTTRIDPTEQLTRTRSVNCWHCRPTESGERYFHDFLEPRDIEGKNAFDLIEKAAASSCNYGHTLLNALKVLSITTKSAGSLVESFRGSITVRRSVPGERNPPLENFVLFNPLGMLSTISSRAATVVIFCSPWLPNI